MRSCMGPYQILLAVIKNKPVEQDKLTSAKSKNPYEVRFFRSTTNNSFRENKDNIWGFNR